MDILLFTLGFCCVIGGIFGSFLPVVPGTPLSYLGLLLLYWTDAVPVNYWVIGITGLITVVVTVLDYVIPAEGTKRFGGSKWGIWGTNIGLIIGLLTPIPFGFIVGPFVGALVGELINNSTNHKQALRAATGSFVGFLASTFIKFVVCVSFLGIYVVVAWKYRGGFI